MRNLLLMSLLSSLAFFGNPMAQQQTGGVHSEFAREGNTYIFRGWFETAAEPSCVLEVLYDFKHLSEFVSGTKAINLIAQGDDWYDVQYVYQKLFFKMGITFRKILERDSNRVRFEMTAYKAPWLFLPATQSSSGYYDVKPAENGCTIEYFQNAVVELRFLNALFLQKAKREGTKFLKALKSYVDRTCH